MGNAKVMNKGGLEEECKGNWKPKENTREPMGVVMDREEDRRIDNTRKLLMCALKAHVKNIIKRKNEPSTRIPVIFNAC